MIVKSKYISARKVAPGKASSALKSHLKYLQYRERGEHETREERHLFSKDNEHVDRQDVHADVMQREQAGDIYYHRLILSPSEDEPVQDWHAWTRDVMHDLEQNQGKDIEWYATVHQNTDNPHVHVVLNGTGQDRETGTAEPVTLSRQDFQVLRESGHDHSEYEHNHQIENIFRDLDQDDQREQQPEHHEPTLTLPGAYGEGIER